MRADPVEITLGDKTWKIRPLTIRQVRKIDPLMTRLSQDTGLSVDIIQIALERDFPDDAAGLADIEANVREIGSALQSVLELGGYIYRDTALGEAVPPKGAID